MGARVLISEMWYNISEFLIITCKRKPGCWRAAFSVIRDRQTESARLADLAIASTLQRGDAVVGAIVSLQAEDSARQRLERICQSRTEKEAE